MYEKQILCVSDREFGPYTTFNLCWDDHAMRGCWSWGGKGHWRPPKRVAERRRKNTGCGHRMAGMRKWSLSDRVRTILRAEICIESGWMWHGKGEECLRKVIGYHGSVPKDTYLIILYSALMEETGGRKSELPGKWVSLYYPLHFPCCNPEHRYSGMVPTTLTTICLGTPLLFCSWAPRQRTLTDKYWWCYVTILQCALNELIDNEAFKWFWDLFYIDMYRYVCICM